MSEEPLSSRTPLGRAPRTLIAALLVGGVMMSYIAVGRLIEAAVGDGPLADFGRIAVPMAVTAWLAPHGSYRRRDALCWLLPPAGLYILAVVAWRVAFLPFRDWPPRPDEAAQLQWLRDRRPAGWWRLGKESR